VQVLCASKPKMRVCYSFQENIPNCRTAFPALWRKLPEHSRASVIGTIGLPNLKLCCKILVASKNHRVFHVWINRPSNFPLLKKPSSARFGGLFYRYIERLGFLKPPLFLGYGHLGNRSLHPGKFYHPARVAFPFHRRSLQETGKTYLCRSLLQVLKEAIGRLPEFVL